MWPFSTKKNVRKSGLFRGFTDWHSHILPGVDDGVQNMKESLAILDLYGEEGVAEVWLTPHIMEDIPNELPALRDRFAELQEAYKGPVNLHLAAENMLDNLFEQRLKDNNLLPIGKKGDHLLVETSYFTPPSDMNEKLKRVRTIGLFPILAHPERYIYMETSDYDELARKDVKLQLNIASIFGYYGPEARKKALYILKHGLYSYSGTDVHRLLQARSIMHKGEYPSNLHSLLAGLA